MKAGIHIPMDFIDFLSVFRIAHPYMDNTTIMNVLYTCKTFYSLRGGIAFRDLYKEQNYNDLVKITKRKGNKLCVHESQVIPEGTEYVCSHYHIEVNTDKIPESVHTLKIDSSLFHVGNNIPVMIPHYIKHLKIMLWNDNFEVYHAVFNHLTHITLNSFWGRLGMLPKNIKYLKLNCGRAHTYGYLYDIPNSIEHLVLQVTEFSSKICFDVKHSRLKFLTIKSNVPEDFVYLGTVHVKFTGKFNMNVSDNMFPNIMCMSFSKRYILPVRIGSNVKYLKYKGNIYTGSQLDKFR